MYMAVKHFKYFLEGCLLKIVTDQKSITRAILAPCTNLLPRQSRYIDFIVPYSTDVICISGSKNVVADCLFWTHCNALFEELPPVFLHKMAVKQANASISNLMDSDTTTLSIETQMLSDSNTNIIGGVSTGSFWLIVPKSMHKQVFDIFHSLSHPGIRATQSLIKERFVWPQINSEIKDWVTTCVPCQTAKVRCHNKAPLKTFLAPDNRFSHIHIDLIGPLNESHCYYYALTIVDRFTRCKAIPLRNIETKTIINAFLLHWVASFSCPSIITCDRGRQFTSNLWHSLCEFLGCKLSHTYAYHPAANSMCERFNKQLKTFLKIDANTDWTSHLFCVLLGIRSSLKEDLGCSSAQLVLGSSVLLPGQYFKFRKYQFDSHFEYFH